MDKDLEIKIRLDRSQATRETQAFAREQKQAEQQVLDDLRVQEQAKRQLVSETNRERVQKSTESLRQQIRADKEAADASVQGHHSVRDAIGGNQDKLASYITTLGGLAAGVRVVNTLAEAFKAVEESQIAAGKAALGFEKSVRDMAALLGMTQGSQAVPKALDFSIKTGLGTQESAEFLRQFEGAIPAGLQKGFITRDVANQLAVEAGIMTARQGGEVKSRGELAALISQFGPVKSAQEGLGQLEAIRMGLTEGRGEDAQLTAALLHIAGSQLRQQGGPVGSLAELSSIVGVMSLSAGPGMADTRTEQLVRGVMGGTKEQQQFKEQMFGIRTRDTAEGPRDTLESALDKMIPKLQAISKTQDVGAYLSRQGFPEEQGRAIVELMENYTVFTERLAKARQAQSGAAVQTANQAFMQSPLGQQMVGESEQVAAEVQRGEKSKEFTALLEREKAQQNIPELKGMATWGGDIWRAVQSGFRPSAEEGERIRIKQGVVERLREQAKGLGVDTEAIRADVAGRQGPIDRAVQTLAPVAVGPLPGLRLGEPSAEEESRALIDAIRERGGNPSDIYRDQANRIRKDLNINLQRQQLPEVPQTALPGVTPLATSAAPTGAGSGGMGGNREVVPLLTRIAVGMERQAGRSPALSAKPNVVTR